MNASAVIGALGVPLSICPPSLDLEDYARIERVRGPAVGESTCASSELRWMKGRVVVDWYPGCSRWTYAMPNVMHEAIHAVLGPDSLQDGELSLMAMTETLIRCVTNHAEVRQLREEFSAYGFAWDDEDHGSQTEVTMSDACFRSDAWREQVIAAGLRTGVIQYRRGVTVPVFGLGPHPAWPAWIAERQRRIQEKERQLRSMLAKPRLDFRELTP